MSAAERASEASSAEQANGGANGPVLYASISYHLKPLCAVVSSESFMKWEQDHTTDITKCKGREPLFSRSSLGIREELHLFFIFLI